MKIADPRGGKGLVPASYVQMQTHSVMASRTPAGPPARASGGSGTFGEPQSTLGYLFIF